nr:hypothetical protein [Tanacetum cinerariifolium]
LSSHTNKYTSSSLTQKVFSNMRRVSKEFLGVETPLFATMLVQPQSPTTEEEDEMEVPAAPTPPSPTIEPLPSPQKHTTTPPQAQPAPSSPPQAQPQPDTSESSMSILNTLMETCATLRMNLNGRGREIEAINADKDITLVDVKKDEEVVAIDAETQGRINQVDVNAASKGVSAAKPTVFDDEEVIMTMA